MEIPTLAAFAPEFLGVYCRNNNKPSEQVTKESTIRVHLEPAFGAMRLDEIDVRAIERFKAKQIERGLNPKSVNNHLMCLSKLLNVAVEWKVLKEAPKIRRLKAPAGDFDFLTFEESEDVLIAADPKWRPMIYLALKTGLRRGELVALQVQDFDMANGKLLVRRNYVRGHLGTPKSGKGREVPLSAKTVEMFAARLESKKAGDLVFPSRRGKLMDNSSTRYPLWAACDRAGIGRRIGWHVLRHTFASHLAMRGVPMKAVQELLGHHSIVITQRYSHLAPMVNRDAVAQLDR